MGRLRIVASGKSPQAQSQTRGKLFEELISIVLRHYGYKIDRIPNVNYSGMEIDIEGRSIATQIPLYAECKIYENEISSAKLQEFFGKYMAKWFQDPRSTGLFVALPGINSHAKGFYRDNCDSNPKVSVRLLEEPEVLEAILSSGVVVGPDVISQRIPPHLGSPGDWLLLYTDRGLYWAQYVVPPGAGVARSVVLLDGTGHLLHERGTLDFLMEIEPELNDFTLVEVNSEGPRPASVQEQDPEEVVEVQGSSACFEYQFPASPRFLVGRGSVLAEMDDFTRDVLERRTSSRGILFEGNSGWGKSSAVLASVDRLRSQGHFAVAIDSRSASSSQFILRVVDYVRRAFSNFDGALERSSVTRQIGGFEAAVESTIQIGRALEAHHKILFIFLDQFENLFFLPDALRHIRDLHLRLCDSQANVVLGFSWKTDLVGLTNDFPYQLRDIIASSSQRITVEKFSEVETSELLERLRQELKARLRKDLTFFLSEFSQGYPWLLKKLCAHVKALREAGVLQADIANSLLNVEELFQQDLKGLSVEEEDALRRIARAAPIGIMELGEDFHPATVQSLVDRRLIVRIGTKYDIYWDIFRDYLNTGKLPVQDNYIIRMQVGSVSKAVKLLVEAGETISVDDFMARTNLTKHSFHNVAKDMKLLGLIKIDDGKVFLKVNPPDRHEDFDVWFGSNLRDRLRRNRLVLRIVEELDVLGSVTLDEVGDILAQTNPYISANKQTWREYARIFADWMDAVGIADFDSRKTMISHSQPWTQIRARRVLPSRERKKLLVPCIHYSPVERAAVRLVDALSRGSRIDWTGFEKSTITKALLTLEQLGFISKKTQAIEVLPKGTEFVRSPDRRAQLFADGALQLVAFRVFLDVLQDHEHQWLSVSELGIRTREKLGVDWKPSTAETNAKIMLNWARHTGLAPGVYSDTSREFMRRIGHRHRRVPAGQAALFNGSDVSSGTGHDALSTEVLSAADYNQDPVSRSS